MSVLGPIGQLGYAVRDLDAWVDHYLSAGVGPWFIVRDFIPASYEHRGQTVRPRFNFAISWSGNVQIELIQPIDDTPNAQSDYLQTGQDGLQHVCYFPRDYAAAKANLEARGYTQYVQGGNSGFQFNYFERPGPVGETIELGLISDETRLIFEKLIVVCAEWDGSDPYRGAFRDSVRL